MSSHSLHSLPFRGKTLRNPQVRAKFHTVLLNCQLPRLFNNLMNKAASSKNLYQFQTSAAMNAPFLLMKLSCLIASSTLSPLTNCAMCHIFLCVYFTLSLM